MDAFIIRPFGVKSEIDFDKVETELIIPSLNKAGIAGFTTGDILESGNIRQDMFQSLLTADVVIADISIHNANVYYELGIRHALRDKVTILIRTKKDEVPFDLKTDRYITYDYPQVDKKVDSLAKSIKDSLLSSHHDSPVFLMLPKLKSQNSEIFLSIPQEFAEEVEIAFETKDLGKLALLAQESSNFPWRLPALRLIGNFEFELRALYNAERTWSLVRDIKRNDREANERLATIYQKLAIEVALDETYSSELFTKSNLAIDRLLNNKSNFSPKELAELYALRASNAKIQWENSWKNNEDYDSKALTSKFLMTAYSFYNSAFGEDLNHFYSGVNALSILTIIIALANKYPTEWNLLHSDNEEAEYKLQKLIKEVERISKVVEFSIQANENQLSKRESVDKWLEFTKADVACLIEKEPNKVRILYERACEQSSTFHRRSAMKQLHILQKLKVCEANVNLALSAFEKFDADKDEKIQYFILFTGHMIDDKNRKDKRFPAEIESEVRKSIKEKLEKQLKSLEKYNITGLAGGACGGDIIFHEVCAELNIKTKLLLALPKDKFINESVSFAGENWIERFNNLYESVPSLILSDEKDLPQWLLKNDPDYSIWERNNNWMLLSALSKGGQNLGLIALWEEKDEAKSGGTAHMIKVGKNKNANISIINPLKFI